MIDELPLPDPADALVDETGRIARQSKGACPRCGAPPSQRAAASGFGRPHPICTRCGYEFTNEVWVEP